MRWLNVFGFGRSKKRDPIPPQEAPGHKPPIKSKWKQSFKPHDWALTIPPPEGPVQLACIFTAADATEDALREIGRRLKTWKEQDARVHIICGLQDLLDGRAPRTPSIYFELPQRPGQFEPLGLVCAVNADVMKETARTLIQVLKGCPEVRLVDPDLYFLINR